MTMQSKRCHERRDLLRSRKVVELRTINQSLSICDRGMPYLIIYSFFLSSRFHSDLELLDCILVHIWVIIMLYICCCVFVKTAINIIDIHLYSLPWTDHLNIMTSSPRLTCFVSTNLQIWWRQTGNNIKRASPFPPF